MNFTLYVNWCAALAPSSSLCFDRIRMLYIDSSPFELTWWNRLFRSNLVISFEWWSTGAHSATLILMHALLREVKINWSYISSNLAWFELGASAVSSRKYRMIFSVSERLMTYNYNFGLGLWAWVEFIPWVGNYSLLLPPATVVSEVTLFQ
jgi:hypothetical protein